MMELQGVRTPIVTAHLTTAALVGKCLSAYLPAPLLDSLNEILATIGVYPPPSHLFTLLTATCSTG